MPHRPAPRRPARLGPLATLQGMVDLFAPPSANNLTPA